MIETDNKLKDKILGNINSLIKNYPDNYQPVLNQLKEIIGNDFNSYTIYENPFSANYKINSINEFCVDIQEFINEARDLAVRNPKEFGFDIVNHSLFIILKKTFVFLSANNISIKDHEFYHNFIKAAELNISSQKELICYLQYTLNSILNETYTSDNYKWPNHSELIGNLHDKLEEIILSIIIFLKNTQ